MFLLIFLQLCGELQTTRNYAALLPKVIQLMAHNDVGVKRICYASYAKHCHKVSNRQIIMPIWGNLQRTRGLTADLLKQEGYATMLLLELYITWIQVMTVQPQSLIFWFLNAA